MCISLIARKGIKPFFNWIDKKEDHKKNLEIKLLCDRGVTSFRLDAKPYLLKDKWIVLTLKNIENDSNAKIAEVFKNKGLLVLLSDHFSDDTEITFFGRKTKANVGNLLLGIKYDVPVIFGYSVFEDGKIKLRFVNEVVIEKKGKLRETLQYNTQKLFYEYEKVIKELYRVLKPNKYCAILIGDTRRNKMYQPLAFMVMQRFLQNGFFLKEDIIKHNKNITVLSEKLDITSYKRIRLK